MNKLFLSFEKIKLFGDILNNYKTQVKYNASFNTDSDMVKMQYTLLRENHVLEKGMTMKNPRKGFGQQKVIALVERLKKYYILYGGIDKEFLFYPLSTIKAYIYYTKGQGTNIENIEKSYDLLCESIGISTDAISVPAGYAYENRNNIVSACKQSYEDLLYNRHSFRYFSDLIPTDEDIVKCLELAQRTPSACNRQAWHTHVYKGEKCHNLLKAQGGCRGFEDNIHCAIVVTADAKGFLSYEPFQSYIDGGLYAMNLINAISYVGMGSIPLSCGFHHDKLIKIKSSFEIPDNENLIVIVGVGYLEETVKVAVSTRQNISKTNKFHF